MSRYSGDKNGGLTTKRRSGASLANMLAPGAMRRGMRKAGIGRLSLLLLTSALVQPAVSASGSLPTGAQLIAGQASVSRPSAHGLSITQTSQRAILGFDSFSVGSGNQVTISQPSSSAMLLGRVTGGTSSHIAGSIRADGHFYLVNPNGIAITSTGVVNAGGGFIASTLDIRNDDFLNGRLFFSGNGRAGVSNRGRISVASGGHAALVGHHVDNDGLIVAPLGRVGLAAGDRVALDPHGDGFLQILLPSDAAGLTHGGVIDATGGQVVIAAAAARDAVRQLVNLSGHVEARSVSGRAGAITISAEGGAAEISGTLDASGSSGGDITVTGPEIHLAGADIDASGDTGGGLVRIGGDWQGGGTLARAEHLSVDAQTIIKADARNRGDGGTVVLWSDRLTQYAGHVSTRGGARGGDGGKAEVSGKAKLDFTGTADLSAPLGAVGSLLLDPYNIIVTNDADRDMDFGFVTKPSADDSILSATTLENLLVSGDVMLSTGVSGSPGAEEGDITINARVRWDTDSRLTLRAYRSVAINAPMEIAGEGTLDIRTNDGGSGGTVSFAGGVQFTGDPNGFQDLQINMQSYGLFYSIEDVESMGLTGRYALARPIVATGHEGFVPVGVDANDNILNGGNGFTGTFTGLGNSITGLSITADGENGTGLFGYVDGGTIHDIHLVDAKIRGNENVGALVGQLASGTVQNSTVSVDVEASGVNVGALIGSSEGLVIDTGVRGAILANAGRAGGLVGINDGIIATSYAEVDISAPGVHSIGGLVGINSGNILQSRASGSVSGQMYVGGLVGQNDSGTISSAYATGSVTGSISVGGLAGYAAGSISGSYASGAVSGSTNVGGFIGARISGTSVSSSYYDSFSTGQINATGFGAVGGMTPVTSDPAKSGDANFAFSQSAYDDLAFTSVPGGAGWYMLEGQTRPFGAWEYSDTITNAHQLQLINMDLNADYLLVNSLDLADLFSSAMAPAGERGGMWRGGFVPIGTDGAGNILNGGNGFAGTFTGLGNNIVDLNIDTDGASYAGLFGYSSGTIADLQLIRPLVTTGGFTGGNVGTIVGLSSGEVRNVAAIDIDVTGNSDVGGLVGRNEGQIADSFAQGGNVLAHFKTGGLVGYQDGGDIAGSWSSADVKGTLYTGGLVGQQDGGSISQSYATGDVDGGSGAGGLVGMNFGGSVSEAYARLRTH